MPSIQHCQAPHSMFEQVVSLTSTDGKSSLLEFVVLTVMKKHPQAANFVDELAILSTVKNSMHWVGWHRATPARQCIQICVLGAALATQCSWIV